MALLYDICLHILLLYLVIDIAILGCSLFNPYFTIVGMSFFNNIVMSIEIIFWNLLLGFGSPTGAFFSVKMFHLIATLSIALLFFPIC